MAQYCEICGKGSNNANRIRRRGKAKKKGGVGRNVTSVSSRTQKPNLQKVKAFVYHELGHFLGIGHENNSVPDIMNPKINGSFLTEETLRYYFQKLKNTPPNNYRKQL
jgi:ribosomal protein L28